MSILEQQTDEWESFFPTLKPSHTANIQPNLAIEYAIYAAGDPS